jgi:orotate phosphoribosyltransferase
LVEGGFTMEKYKEEFIDFMVDSGALLFGDFMTKSGRKTPYFINIGDFNSGSQLTKLGEFYAQAINQRYGLEFDALFGPAYKGISLAVSTSIAMEKLYGKEVKYCYNCKEDTNNSVSEMLLGAELEDGDKVIVIEDVTTAGTSMKETMPIIKSQGNIEVVGLIVSVDRLEKGYAGKAAFEEIAENYNIEVFSIVTLNEIIERLYNKEHKGKIIIDDKIMSELNNYLDIYGVK